MKTDQEAADEWIKDQEKKGNWLSIDALPGKSYCQSYDLAFLAGCAHRDRAHKEELKEKLREAFDAARKHPNWCDPVLIEQYHHKGPGNSAGTYWRAKKINYEYSNFDEWLTKQEDFNEPLKSGEFQAFCKFCDFALTKNAACKPECPNCGRNLWVKFEDRKDE